MSTEKKQLLEETDAAIREIAEGGNKALSAIYSEYRGEFLAWAKRNYNISKEDALDIFQDAVIVFYKNIIKGKITKLESSIKTYLFGICKNMFMKSGLKRKKVVLVEDVNDALFKNIDWTLLHTLELSPRKEVIKEALTKLTEICYKIIHLFYYKGFSMEAIKEHMAYNSVDVARTSKLKCMRKLEIIIKEKRGK